MTLGTLPPLDTVRWVPKRKASLVRGLQAGLLTFDEACARYSLSADELLSWQRELARDARAAFAYHASKPTETSGPDDTQFRRTLGQADK